MPLKRRFPSALLVSRQQIHPSPPGSVTSSPFCSSHFQGCLFHVQQRSHSLCLSTILTHQTSLTPVLTVCVHLSFSTLAMEILIIVGTAALIGAYASSRNSRDRELARQAKKALSDAKKANKRGDPQAAAYYIQVARDLSVQRLTEAEQRATNEALQLQADGHPHRAEKKLAKAREIRATLVRDFQAQAQLPASSLPVAVPPSPTLHQSLSSNSSTAYPAIQPYAEYSSQLHSPPSASPHSASYSSPSYLPPAPRYKASASDSAPPSDAVRYYNQPPLPVPNFSQPGYHVAAVPYQQPPIPSVAPPPYVPSISSSPSSQPWVAPNKVR